MHFYFDTKTSIKQKCEEEERMWTENNDENWCNIFMKLIKNDKNTDLIGPLLLRELLLLFNPFLSPICSQYEAITFHFFFFLLTLFGILKTVYTAFFLVRIPMQNTFCESDDWKNGISFHFMFYFILLLLFLGKENRYKNNKKYKWSLNHSLFSVFLHFIIETFSCEVQFTFLLSVCNVADSFAQQDT